MPDDGYPAMRNVDGRVAVLVRSYGAQLGRLDLKVDVGAKKVLSAEWTKIPIDASIPQAPDVAKKVAEWEGKVSKLVDVPIGEAQGLLHLSHADGEVRVVAYRNKLIVVPEENGERGVVGADDSAGGVAVRGGERRDAQPPGPRRW